MSLKFHRISPKACFNVQDLLNSESMRIFEVSCVLAQSSPTILGAQQPTMQSQSFKNGEPFQ